MKTQTIYVDACTSTGIAIGRRNTYATEQIVFGLAPLVQQYGAGSAVLMVLRPTDTTPYPAVTSQSGTELTWTVSATDTSVPGIGECELYWYVDGGLAKSVIFPLTIQRDIITEPIDEPPEPYQTWVDDLTDLGAETLQNAQAAAQSAAAAEAAKTAAQAAQTGAEAAKTAAQGAQAGAETARAGAEAAQTAAETAQGKAEDAQEAAENAKTDAEAAARQAEEALEEFTTPTASATTLEPDEEATASYANGHFTFGIPQGVQGQPGQPGQPGVTPDFSIGTVQTLQPSQQATASITGTAEHPVLNLGIPQGVQGDPATNLVQSVNGKTGAVVLDAGDIGYDGETTYPDASVGKELKTINSALSSLQSVTEIIDTASGAIASFPDGAGLPMRSLVAEINPVQDLHGQSSPYPAGGGANKWDEETESGYINADGSYGTSTTALRSKNFCPCVGGETYYFVKPSTYTTTPNICWYDSEQNFISRSTTSEFPAIPAPSNANYFKISMWAYGATYNHDIAINYPSTVTTYSPYSNICPISGWTGVQGQRTGKNQIIALNTVAQNSGITFTGDGKGKVEITGIATQTYPQVNVVIPQELLPVGATVTMSTSTSGNIPSGAKIYAVLYERETPNGQNIESHSTRNGNSTFTVVRPYQYVVIVAEGNGLNYTGANVVAYIQIEYGSSATAYEEPKTPEAISITFPSTIYGGTDELVSGNGTSTMGMVDMGDLTWTKLPTSGSNYWFRAPLVLKEVPSANDKPNMLCSSYATETPNNVYLGTQGISKIKNYDYVVVCDMRYSDAVTFKAAMSGVQLCYELKTPTTFTHEGQTVDTLVGQNNVWVDTGSVEVTYPADTKLYIDKKIAEALA